MRYVPYYFERRLIDSVDIGRRKVQMYDFAEFWSKNDRRLLTDVVSEHDDKVGLAKGMVHVVSRRERSRADIHLRAFVFYAFSHLGRNERHAGLLKERSELLADKAAVRAGRDNEYRILGIFYHAGSLLDSFWIWSGTANFYRKHRDSCCHFGRDVFGQFDMHCTRTFCLGELHRLADHAWDAVGRHYGGGIFRDGAHHFDNIEYLELSLLAALYRFLPRDGEYWHAAELGIRHSCEEIGCAGPESRDRDADLAGQAPDCRGHKYCGLLVTRDDELYRTRAESLHEREVFLARHAEDILDPFLFKALNEYLRGGVFCMFHSYKSLSKIAP